MERAADALAVDTLLISDKLFRYILFVSGTDLQLIYFKFIAQVTVLFLQTELLGELVAAEMYV